MANPKILPVHITPMHNFPANYYAGDPSGIDWTQIAQDIDTGKQDDDLPDDSKTGFSWQDAGGILSGILDIFKPKGSTATQPYIGNQPAGETSKKDNTFLYVIIAAVVLILLIIILKKK